MTEPASSAALAAASPVIKEALKGLGPAISRGASTIRRSLIDRAVANLQIGFSDFLHTSYERCKFVKTLLSQDRPLALLDIYVHLYLTCGNERIEDERLIHRISDYKRVIITGLAGSGKTMFTKYLTVYRFNSPSGILPLFVELRLLNSQRSIDLLRYIHQFCTSATSKVTYRQFELALQSGAFLIILDGFDEIELAARDHISNQILEIGSKYPQVPMVISSRPDDRFSSWQSFFTFTVNPLDKFQVLELIRKINYDTETKERFRTEVDDSLFGTHESFLSSPLLASIMLLTYEQFGNIPRKMHIYYEQAFLVLFSRHDAQKAQFVRKTHSGLPIDDFKRVFAAFCAFSYLEQQFVFENKEIEKQISKALEYTKIKSNWNDIERDLHECVSMLQKDGTLSAFVHRSFQEYFCSIFLSDFQGPQLRRMIDLSARRYEDQVVSMLFELARYKLDREWAIPHIDDLVSTGGRNYLKGNMIQVFFRSA